ncbi:hypothetical protein DFJ68_2433 [Terracoccus luteus]|uniref:DUF3562 domain-containing protein n=1 Tax=Terracoccus luteus TaxID=53356 RepID=A0A495Y075_9MICO|nr:hypothetical protein [Terracoccus luteus]RKT78979.1 hypothetical protein DFJ68_2433 [Terracoccus luteus]
MPADPADHPRPDVDAGPEPGPVEQERQALTHVYARLAERFPSVDPTVIEAAVRLEHVHLDGPIRDYVPVLVEHAARDRIAAFASRGPEADEPV